MKDQSLMGAQDKTPLKLPSLSTLLATLPLVLSFPNMTMAANTIQPSQNANTRPSNAEVIAMTETVDLNVNTNFSVKNGEINVKVTNISANSWQLTLSSSKGTPNSITVNGKEIKLGFPSVETAYVFQQRSTFSW